MMNPNVEDMKTFSATILMQETNVESGSGRTVFLTILGVLGTGLHNSFVKLPLGQITCGTISKGYARR